MCSLGRINQNWMCNKHACDNINVNQLTYSDTAVTSDKKLNYKLLLIDKWLWRKYDFLKHRIGLLNSEQNYYYINKTYKN